MIFCLDNDWSDELYEMSSVRPLLSLMYEVSVIDFIYRTVGTADELRHYAELWRQDGYAEYRVGYLHFQSMPGMLQGRENELDLAKLAELLGPCEGRVIHLSGCRILGTADSGLIAAQFLQRTGALAVCGYTEEDPNWIERLAFDLLLLDWFVSEPDDPLGAIREAQEQHEQFAAWLGFVSHSR